MSSMIERSVSVATESGCPECDGSTRIEEGETVCVECGLVVDEDRLDRGPGNPYKEGHHGDPLTTARHDRGLGTASLGTRDASGEYVESARLSRMRTQETRAHFESKGERNLAHGFGEIERIRTALGQGDRITESAGVILRRAHESGLFPGRSIEGLAAASVVAAIRLDGGPFSVDDVGPYARVDAGRVWNAYQVINRELGLPTPPPTIASHLPRIASAVDLPEDDRADALELANALDESALSSGFSRRGAAATCIYAVTGRFGRYTQAELAEEADVSPMTIQDQLQAIEAAGLDDVLEEGST